MEIKAVIFDLDGVIVSTDECHYRAWKKVADEEGIYFDEKINMRLRGVSRMESLEIMLENAPRAYSVKEKSGIAQRKNGYYCEYISDLTPASALPGIMGFINALKSKGIKTAIGSSSKNTGFILKQLGLENSFGAVVGGNDISKSKPDPEVFLLAAAKLGEKPENCVVLEDADAGIEAGLSAGMKVIAVGSASKGKNADFAVKEPSDLRLEQLQNL